MIGFPERFGKSTQDFSEDSTYSRAADLSENLFALYSIGRGARIHLDHHVLSIGAQFLERAEPTFNFEVDDVHNYFVASGVLVHNGSPEPQNVSPSPEKLLGLKLENKSAFESAKTLQIEGAKAGRVALQAKGLWKPGFRLDIPTQMQDITHPGNQPHIHGFDSKGRPWSLNINGTLHDAKSSTGTISPEVKSALRGAGWEC